MWKYVMACGIAAAGAVVAETSYEIFMHDVLLDEKNTTTVTKHYRDFDYVYEGATRYIKFADVTVVLSDQTYDSCPGMLPLDRSVIPIKLRIAIVDTEHPGQTPHRYIDWQEAVCGDY